QNFDDINYSVKANGTIDLGKIYQVFSQKGLDVSGFIKADLSLQGRQSDAMQGRYSRLHNQGLLQLSDIKTLYESFPQPFIIKQGLFRFKEEKMWFNTFNAVYGQSDFSMNGYLQNAIDYALSNKGTLKGNFTLNSRYINADELMAFAPPSGAPAGTAPAQPAAPAAETGVFIVPANLDLVFTATARKVAYNGLLLDSVAGNIRIDSGKLWMAKTGFNLIGCKVLMDAGYGSLSPRKAYFDYHLQATDFDINKAYREIKLFHDMATSAGKAYGIVSLDYNLKGKLDGNMRPIYPSLEGGGVLSLKKIKVKGLKLFSAVSKETGKEGLNDPDLSKVDIKTTIKNNILTLERLKMKIAGFRPRIEGQVSLDGRLNLKMRLGLPPFGIIGIPMRVTGTQENPKIKLGKNDKEEIPETEYKED
ncbi:MAG TPA: AsmA-like C-terminal region-containing protein, partial [Chitinophagaceae bacterium]|nr:AsmA-like C-terminal region-containing protein [Chitinophagaceae bacterium]